MDKRRVIFFRNGKLENVAEEEFVEERDKLFKEKREQVKLEEAPCMMCGKSPSRFNINIAMHMCDLCFHETSELEMKSERTRKVQKELPDMILPGVFIGSKDCAVDVEDLKKNGIERILCCCSHLQLCIEDMEYLR